MPDYSLVIAIVAFVVVAVIAFKVIKGVVKAVVTVLAITAIFTGVAGFLIASDANDLKNNFSSGKNIFLMTSDGEVFSGLEFHGEKTPKVISQQQLDEYAALIDKDDYDSILDGYYKLVIIDKAVLSQGELAGIESAPYSEDKARYLLKARNKILSNPLIIASEYKKGNVYFYPETPVFKVIKLVPISFMKAVANRLLKEAKEVVVETFEK